MSYRKQWKTTYQLLIVYIVIGINITVQILHNKWVMTILMPFAIMFYHFKIIFNLRKYIWFWLIYMNYLKDETIHFFFLYFHDLIGYFHEGIFMISWGYFHEGIFMIFMGYFHEGIFMILMKYFQSPLEWITACVALKWLFFGMLSLISLITRGSERHDAICCVCVRPFFRMSQRVLS